MTGLGDRLREAREAKGLSLEAVERETRISRRYLQALETENLEALPAPVYARGFLRSYAQFLGLDPKEFLPILEARAPREKVVEPLPQLAPPHPQRVNWLVIGLVTLVLGLAGLYLLVSVLAGGSGGEEPPPVAGSGAAAATVEVPDVRGRSVEEAVAEVSAAGLKYVVVEVQDGGHPPGTVYAQHPDPGERLPEGGLVALTAARRE
ncbi:MAG TPA: helix-turn-helix domain-containing protein [Dehalococcoidia bacterium]